jgi:hypothetical protein
MSEHVLTSTIQRPVRDKVNCKIYPYCVLLGYDTVSGRWVPGLKPEDGGSIFRKAGTHPSA